MVRSSKLAILAACGAVAGLSSSASAQPAVVSVSGATLLENYLNQGLATVDFIDADGNGQSRGVPLPCRVTQQLAPSITTLPPIGFGAAAVWDPSIIWGVQYTAVGSTRGLQELIDNGRTYNTGESGKTTGALAGRPIPAGAIAENACMDIDRRSSAFFNTTRYITTGNLLAGNPLGNYRNAGGAPVRVNTDGTFRAIWTSQDVAGTSPNEGLAVTGGVTVDAAILDVPVRYAVRNTGGTPTALRKPGQGGYGDNPRVAQNPDGTATTQSNKLASLTPTSSCSPSPAANINTAAPDANTIFDTPLFLAPVAPIANFGTGVTQINISNLSHLFTTGRLVTGENLVAVTRDSGSGTRNAWDNTVGHDPSFGVGDNIGAVNNTINNDRLGASFLPVNKNGNPRVEQTVYNHRLAIGYVGPERGVSNSSPDIQWLPAGYCDIPSVVNDSYGGSTPQRPTCTAIAENQTAESWVIAGPASFGTFGDPRSAPADKGGYGWMEPFCDYGADGLPGTSDAGETDGLYTLGEPFSDFNSSGVRDAAEPRPGALPPAMRNLAAATFVNNITRSIDAFEAGFTTATTPGQLAAQRFFLVNAARRIQNPNNPTDLIPNPAFNPALQAFILGSPSVVCNNTLYTSFGQGVRPISFVNSRAGKVPARIPGTYSDGVTATGNFTTEGGVVLDQDGDLATTGARDELPLRNLISGDFNGDGLRNISDSLDIVSAMAKRNPTALGLGAPFAWSAPSGSGALAALGLATGQTVAGSDVCIEIIGDFNGDGSFTRADLRYFADGLALQTSGPNAGKLDRKAGFIALDNATSAVTGGANNNLFGTVLATGKPYAAGDSRGDVVNAAGLATRGAAPTGEGTINARDIDYVFRQFKNPNIIDGAATWSDQAEAIFFDLSADITGDLVVDQADVSELVIGILGTCAGDVNLDGAVNSLDAAIIDASIATPPASPSWASGDINGDNVVDAADRALYCPADINCSGTVTVQDIFDFLSVYFASAPKADINGSGTVTVQDIFDFLNVYFAGC